MEMWYFFLCKPAILNSMYLFFKYTQRYPKWYSFHEDWFTNSFIPHFVLIVKKRDYGLKSMMPQEIPRSLQYEIL